MKVAAKTKGSLQYLDDAPSRLVELHRDKKIRRKVGKADDLLGCLLTHPSMAKVWKILRRKIPDRGEAYRWERLYMAIVNAYADSRQPPVPEEESAYCEDVGKKAAELAKLLRRRTGKAIFNLPAYRFCPGDVMKANGVKNWESLDSLGQASRSIIEWPFMTELLDGLQQAAQQEKGRVRDDLVMKRIARGGNRKLKPETQETFFLRALHPHLASICTSPKDKKYVVLGTIAGVVFGRPDNPRDAKLVEKNINGS